MVTVNTALCSLASSGHCQISRNGREAFPCRWGRWVLSANHGRAGPGGSPGAVVVMVVVVGGVVVVAVDKETCASGTNQFGRAATAWHCRIRLVGKDNAHSRGDDFLVTFGMAFVRWAAKEVSGMLITIL